MSQPPVSGRSPDFQPPLTGGYGGALQAFGAPHTPPPVSGYAAPAMQAPPVQPSAYPVTLAQLQTDQPPQRPAVITMAATLTVTASLQWVAGLTMLWLVAVAAGRQLGTSGADGAVFHIFSRFNDRMATGLAWPMYGFPLVSLLLGFLLPARGRWVRIALTAVGAVAVLWLAWLFLDNLVWFLVPGTYVVIVVALLWTTAANRWYGWNPPSEPAAQPR